MSAMQDVVPNGKQRRAHEVRHTRSHMRNAAQKVGNSTSSSAISCNLLTMLETCRQRRLLGCAFLHCEHAASQHSFSFDLGLDSWNTENDASLCHLHAISMNGMLVSCLEEVHCRTRSCTNDWRSRKYHSGGRPWNKNRFCHEISIPSFGGNY